MRCVIFDLDGTLVDSSADLVAAANAALEHAGVVPALHPVRDASTAFRGGRAMLRLGFARAGISWNSDDLDRAYAVLLDAYEGRIDAETKFYPGALDAVKALRRDGWATGICTNKPERLARMLIDRLAAAHLFDSLVGADTLPVRKPDPAPLIEAVARAGGEMRQSVLVGDTLTDRETARAAGVSSIMITFGPDGRGVAELKPHALLDRFDDLPGLVADLVCDALDTPAN